MAIDYKDYYKTLGLARGAAEEDIRNAFRRLARQFHPDKTGNDPNAENQFKEINEAYEVLGDPAKRQRYDQFVGAWESGGPGPEGWEGFIRSGSGGRGPNFEGGSHEHYSFDGAGFS